MTFPGLGVKKGEVESWAWPHHRILRENCPRQGAGLWLENRIFRVLLLARCTHLAAARLPAAERSALSIPLGDFVGCDKALFRSLERLRLQQPSLIEIKSLIVAIAKVVEALSAHRSRLIFELEGEARRHFLRREKRLAPNPLELEEELRRRIAHREFGNMPSGVQELTLRRRRDMRRRQDQRNIPPNAPLEALMSHLPEPWLYGILLQLGGSKMLSRRADKEKWACEALRSPKILKKLVLALPCQGHLILETLLDGTGSERYDLLTHKFGADDAGSWYWFRQAPRHELERVRRTGLLMVGQSPVEGVNQCLGFVPEECRTTLTKIFLENPRQPWLSPDVTY